MPRSLKSECRKLRNWSDPARLMYSQPTRQTSSQFPTSCPALAFLRGAFPSTDLRSARQRDAKLQCPTCASLSRAPRPKDWSNPQWRGQVYEVQSRSEVEP